VVNGTLEVVRFQGDELIVKRVGAHVYVAITPFCRVLGIKEATQHAVIIGDPVLSKYTHMGVYRQGRPSVFLRLDRLNGWLFKINSRKVKIAIQAKIIAYQEHCYDVLFAHFNGRSNGQRKIETPEQLLDRYQDMFSLPGAVGRVLSEVGQEPAEITEPLPIFALERQARARVRRTGVPIEVLRVLFWRVALREHGLAITTGNHSFLPT
jgi:hypothetical protein